MPPPPTSGLIGRPLRRSEDERLITGRGAYAGDLQPAGLLHLALLRSPLPHALINSIDVEAARALPGVVAVWTAADLGPALYLSGRRAEEAQPTDWPVLAADEAHYIGDPLVAVFADDPYVAQDAAQSILADLEPLPAVGDVLSALAPGAPLVHERLGSNSTAERSFAFGDVDSAFAGAPVVVRRRLTTARVAGASMEPRAVTGEYDAARDSIRLWTSTQSVFGVRTNVARALGLPPDQVEVMAEDIGGGFGEKAPTYPEEVLVALAARRLGRPVRWIATRSEHTATTVHGHGSVFDVELAADADGKLRGVRGDLYHDFGAYAGSAAGQPGVILGHMISAYVLPAMDMRQHLVHTNAVPGGFIRGGGRPLGNFVIERLMDLLAHELGMDPLEVRRRNLIRPDQMPYDTHFPQGRSGSVVYDSGNYPQLLAAAADAIAYDAVATGPKAGKLIGKSVVCCVESTGFGGHEPCRIQIHRDGVARVYVGSTPQGQGHRTMTAQVVADRLGWPLERIVVRAADTRWVPEALVTAGSRSAVQVGNAAAQAAATARQRVLEHAAEHLHVYPNQVELGDGSVGVAGAPESRVPVAEVPPAEGIDVLEVFEPLPRLPLPYSAGSHAAVVQVDPETGHVDVLRYVMATDNGRDINPRLVEGQLQGGFAHGLGYAMYEEAIYQPDGSFVSASFLDYTIVGAPETSAQPEHLKFETVTEANPESFKGAGESGTIPVPAAIAGAVESALRSVRPQAVVDHIPITPLHIHQLLSGS